MNDFETKLKQSLNRSVDAQLGARRIPPPFQPVPDRSVRRRAVRPWVAPLVVAACVAATLIATVTGTNLLSERRAATPGSSSPAPPTPTVTQRSEAPTPTGSSMSDTPTPSSTPSATSTLSASSTAPAPTPTVVRLADASIWLPAGWQATLTDQSEIDSRVPGSIWCIGPAGDQGSGVNCPVRLIRSVLKPNSGGGYNSDAPDGSPYAHQALCPLSVPYYSGPVLDAGDRDFGGRMADYRVFKLSCSAGTENYVQYLVPAGPAFDLFAPSADEALQATMAEIVQHSVLPKQTSALRYYDYGYVRGLVAMDGGYKITLDRVMIGPNGPINNNSQTYEYFASHDNWSVGGPHPALGDLAVVETDGTHVFVTYKVPF